jgi:DNA-binding IclR family transcriptional regulator
MAKRAKSAAPVKAVSSAAAFSGADERYLVPALIRGLDILRTLSGDRGKLTLSEVAASLEVTRSSAYRLLYTLGHLGFVDYDSETKNYALGPEVLQLGYGYLVGRDLVEVATPHLVRLRDHTGWSAHLGELHGREVVYLARVATRRSIASTVHVGTRLPARPTTMGRILLSALDEQDIRNLFRDERNGVGGLAGLLRQVDEDRARGFVIQNSVYEPGVASVAAPVRDMAGRVIAAINISAVAMFTSDAELNGQLKTEVLAAAEAISRDLGRTEAAAPEPPAPRRRRSGK